MTSKPKPAFLGASFGDQFADQSIVDVYHLRPPYPAAVFDMLESLMSHSSNRMLDVGCGTGEIARALASGGLQVDAVDPSVSMITRAQALPHGDSPAICWVTSTAESLPLSGPYALIVAGASLHWMDWSIVMPKFATMLGDGGIWPSSISTSCRLRGFSRHPHSVRDIQPTRNGDHTVRSMRSPPEVTSLNQAVWQQHQSAFVSLSRTTSNRSIPGTDFRANA